MISSKREEDQKREEQEREAQKTAFDNGQSPESVKKNPNPKANENLSDKKKPEDGSEEDSGVGSEITDGEDG